MDCGNRKRYLVAVLCAIGLFILANVQHHLELTVVGLSTNESTYYIATASSHQRARWLSALDIGIKADHYTSFVSMLIAANFILKWNAKIMLAIGIAGSSFFNIFVPLALRFNSIVFIILCVFKGFFEGLIFPYFLTIWSHWAPIKENTTLLSISLFGYFLGQSFKIKIFSHSIYVHFGVPFYIFGGLGACWTILWSIFVKEKPSEDSNVSSTEQQRINHGDNDQGIKTLNINLRKQVFMTKSTISIFFVILCSIFNFAVVTLTIANLLLHRQDSAFLLQLELTELVSYLVTAFVVLLVAVASDLFRHTRDITIIRKVFICTGLFGSGLLLPFIGIYYPQSLTAHLALFGLLIVLQGMIVQGYFVNVLDVAHRAVGYAFGIAFGLASFLAGVILFIALLSSYIISDNIYETIASDSSNLAILFGNLNHVYFLAVTLNAIACIVYFMFGSAKRESWTMENTGNLNTPGANTIEFRNVSVQPYYSQQ